ncbi:AT-hook motif nuclear-localized protein 2-like [Triticum urartu]|uniref:AT-hook motif nuclear-localized protein n=1 Tax=Triticum urartu TaxID=4572 RepID=A0A8R7V2E1_TRIUA|nr:AT-hook motif nuclear-localized protein 2-like [Triticum urartu]XP_048539881.1 AT-hook motif nuclear-localized protein 2-like [Triticum urartu]XP_048539882.1 AT-hook motif nuclear-localized protein 2-like [Triticum urartu]XP_048539883.1 AT-hook motif nuclear-localized protein 2-like [Triticum urartu]XP_048539884.1 AT-hook motif nuclear-localized protein 2-like [Triticum urartu]
MSEAAGEAAYGADMPESPLHPQPQPIVGGRLDDAHEGNASYSAPHSSCPTANNGVVHVPAMSASSEPPKQKRGRPRKYTPDGTKPPAIFPAPYPIGVVASPTPVLPPGFTLGLWGVGVVRPQAPLPSPLPPPPFENSKQRAKKKRVWPPRSTTSKKQRELAVAEPDATGFVPQVITIQGGEDVAAKVISYCGNGWAVCILSAEGAVCNVTLKQPASSCGTVIYEGYFDIVSLSGMYLLSKSNGLSTLKGGFSISLVGHDGSLFGGGLAGPLIAASPVQVVFGRFAADEKEEIKQDVASGRFAADEKEEIKQDVASGGFADDEKEEIKQDVASGGFAADEKEEIKQDVASGTPGATTPTAAPNETSSGPGSPSN